VLNCLLRSVPVSDVTAHTCSVRSSVRFTADVGGAGRARCLNTAVCTSSYCLPIHPKLIVVALEVWRVCQELGADIWTPCSLVDSCKRQRTVLMLPFFAECGDYVFHRNVGHLQDILGGVWLQCYCDGTATYV
jgi:hypothetical protein